MSLQEPGKGRERQGKAMQRWAGRETSDYLRFWVTSLNIFPPTIPPQTHEKTVAIQSMPRESQQDGESCKALVTERWGPPG